MVWAGLAIAMNASLANTNKTTVTNTWDSLSKEDLNELADELKDAGKEALDKLEADLKDVATDILDEIMNEIEEAGEEASERLDHINHGKNEVIDLPTDKGNTETNAEVEKVTVQNNSNKDIM